MADCTRRSGFTLIELSIVLVIIGLIVGGVLGGREMIEAAKIRKQVAQFEQIAAASSVFKNKYNYYPGDMTGNKNGVINDQNGAQLDVGTGMHEQNAEPLFFFSGLVNDNLIESKFICPPVMVGNLPRGNYASVLNDAASLLATTHGRAIWLFMGMEFNQSTCGNNNISGAAANVMTPAQAQTIDQKMDDGAPGTGNFYATKFSTGGNLTGAVDNTASACVVDATSTQYNVTNSAKLCKLMIKLP